MARKSKRVPTDGSSAPIASNPFAALDATGLPMAKPPPNAPKAAPSDSSAPPRSKSRGRLDIVREKAGRRGKTVTVVRGFKGISHEEKAALAKSIQKRCGAGGSVKGGQIEIQGDRREAIKAILEAAGFAPVFAGG